MAQALNRKSLGGRVAIVTGAGRGIGRAEAIALAREGAAVVVNDPGYSILGRTVDQEHADSVVEEIINEGGRAIASYLDCSSWSQSKGIINAARDAFGGLDILVNNAGTVRDRMSFNMSAREFKDVVDVHLFGSFSMARHAAAFWRTEAKAGRARPRVIINTTSESAFDGMPAQANYSAAKGGVASLTLTLAQELRPYGIRVNAIAPSMTRTRLLEVSLGDRLPASSTASEEWDPMDPQNIGVVVAWMASDAADFTGEVIWVAGTKLVRYRGWSPVAAIERENPWTVDELVVASNRLFVTPHNEERFKGNRPFVDNNYPTNDIYGSGPRIEPIDLDKADDGVLEVLSGIEKSSGSTTRNWFRTLAKNPGLLRKYLPFGGKLLSGGSLPDRYRELVVLRVASLSHSSYELSHHRGLATAVGLSADEISAAIGEGSVGCLSTFDGALVAAATQLHRDQFIDEAVWSTLSEFLSEKQLIELLFLIGHYQMVAGIMNTLGVVTEGELEHQNAP